MRAAWTLVLTVLLLSPSALAASAEVVGQLPVPPSESGPQNGLVGATAVYHQGTTYVFGGRMVSNEGEISDRIYAYDHASGQAREVGRLPTATGTDTAGRFSASGAVLGDKIYVFGGAVFVDADLGGDHPTRVPKAIKDVVAFTPSTGDVSVLATQLPDGLWGMSAVSNGQKAWLFGGFTFDISNPSDIARRDSIVEFTPPTSLLPATALKLDKRLPFPLQDSAAALFGSRAYVFGGLGDNENSTNRCPDYAYEDPDTGETQSSQQRVCASETILAFDISSGSVEVLRAKLPYRGQFLHAAVVNGKAYIAGARLQDGSASASIVEFNPSAVTPVRVLTPTLPVGLFAAPATTDGTTITLFGGRMASLVDMTSNVTRIDPRATAPWAPRSVVARAVGTNATVSWEAPAYDGDAAVTAYRVYRAEAGAAEAHLGDTQALTYQDAGLAPNVEYVYRVTAVNPAGESAVGGRASTFSSAVPPGPVASLVAYAGDREILLRWTPPADDGGASVTGYRVYRDGALVQSLPFQDLEWRDDGVTNGVQYAYDVRAVNAQGEGASSAIQRATPKDLPPPPATIHATADAQGVTLAWSAPPATAKTLVLLRGVAPTTLSPVQNLAGSATGFVDDTVERGRTWYYAVASANDAGQGPPSEIVAVTLVDKPDAPAGLSLTPLEASLRLAWQAPQNAGVTDPSTVTYFVKRNGHVVANDLKATAFTDSGLLPGQTYVYTVTAFNGLSSDESASVSGSPRQIANQAPAAIAAVLTSVVQAGDLVTIDGSRSNDPDGTIAEYAWDYGDGSPVERTVESTAQHAYAKNGTYTVKLVVKDNRQAESAPATAAVIVGAIEGKTPDDSDVQPTTQTGARPGTGKTQPIPAPGVGLVLLAAAGVALRRRR